MESVDQTSARLAPRSSIFAPIRFEQFAGREREVAFLLDRIRASRDGRGSLVVVSGPAGIGKSRLIAQLFAAAEKSGLVTAIGRSHNYHHRPLSAFSGIVDQLRLGDVEPSLHALKGDAATIAATLMRAFTVKAKNRALVIALDDIHWSDEDSRNVLEGLAESIERLRVVIIANVRTEDVSYDGALNERLARLERLPGTYRIELATLDRETMAALIAENLPPSRTPFAVREALVTVADGNPFYAEELVRLYINDNRIAPETLPRTLTATIQARLSRLSPVARETLRIASALGSTTTIPLLATLSKCGDEALFEAIREALEAQLVRVPPHDQGRLEFAHPVIRETIRLTLLGTESRALHRRILYALLASGCGDLAVLAEQANLAEDSALARMYCERAGDEAALDGRVNHAAIQFERAVRHASDDGDRYRLFSKLAMAHEASGEFVLGRSAAENAAELAEHAGRPSDAVLRLLETARMANNSGDLNSLDDLSKRCDRLVAGDDAIRLRKETAFATYYALGGDTDRSRAHLEMAEKQIGGPLSVFEQQYLVCARVATYALLEVDWRHEAEAALADVRFSEVSRFATNAIFAYVALPAGETEFARRCADAMQKIASEANIPAWTTGAATTSAVVAWHQGQLDHTRTCAMAALAQAGHAGVSRMLSLAVALLSGALVEDRKLVERALDTELLDAALATCNGTRFGLLAYGFCESYRAHADRRPHAQLLERALMALNGRGFGAWNLLADIASHGDDSITFSARTVLATEAASHGRVPQAFLALFDAEYARRRGHAVAAQRAGTLAAKAFSTLEWPYYEARALEAAGAIAEAVTLYEAIGDRRDVARLRPSNLNADATCKSVLGRLTRREREVALLVADGHTTPHVAATLVLSRRTVDAHLDSIFRKLDIATRSGLAARVATELGEDR